MVRKALGDAGAGKIGSYSHCSFSIDGKGRFLPLKGANPTTGEVGKYAEVIEERIECICEREIAKEVIKKVRKVHPYEKVVFDIYQLIDENEL